LELRDGTRHDGDKSACESGIVGCGCEVGAFDQEDEALIVFG
jgi:hypothetical protein